jgi:hypothetical protein
MACFNCTARVLRVFIHDSLSPTLFRHIPRKPRYQPGRVAQLQQFRRESTLSESTDRQTFTSFRDDDFYIPWTETSAGESLPGSVARSTGLLPLSPDFDAAEPEIVLTSEARREAEEVSSLSEEQVNRERGQTNSITKNIEVSLPLKKARKNEAKKLQRPPAPPNVSKPHLGVLDKLLACKDSKQGKKEKSDRRSAWELPPIEDLASTNKKFRDLRNHIATTPRAKVETWKIEKLGSMKKVAGQPWAPAKRLSPEALEGIRTLHAQHPEKFPTPKLAELFQVSSEVIKRILRSKWKSNAEEAADRERRWEGRGQDTFNTLVESGAIKTWAIRKRERKEREKRLKYKTVADDGPSMSNRIL